MYSDAAWRTLTPHQVRGKVLVIEDSGTARFATSDIDRLGFALVVTLSRPLSQKDLLSRPWLEIPPVDESAPRSAAKRLRIWDPAVLAAIRSAADGTVSLKIPAPATTPVKLRNVVGVLRGSDPSLRETFELVTAHYDHLGVYNLGAGDQIYNGANDNASGTAALIGIADAMTSLPQKPKRSIVFLALFGEEVGMLGSQYYTDHPLFPLEKTVADVNLDELGRTDVESGPSVGQFSALGFDYTSITEVLRLAGLEVGIRVVRDEKYYDSDYGGSDNWSFANVGIPAISLTTGPKFPDYHKPGDEWQKLDYDNMARVTQAVALGIYRLADSTGTPQWNKQNPNTARYVQAQEKAAAARQIK